MPNKNCEKVAPEKATDKPQSKKQLRSHQLWSESVAEPGGVMEVDAAVLESINARLSKLDMLDSLQHDIRELKTSLEFSQQQIEDLRKENAFLKGVVKEVQQSAVSLTLEKKRMKETLLDIQCRDMRDNLIFSGISEKKGEEKAEPEQLVKEFMSKKLNLSPEVVRDITFSRVHRLGRPAEGKSRPIIARFEHYKHKELVKSRGKELKGTSLWLNDHFPVEINDRRKKLFPIMKEKRALDHRVALSVDRLYIDGQLYRDSEVTPWLF